MDMGDDLAEAKLNARERLQLWRTRAIYSLVALLLSCASVIPFLYGHSLHRYWESLGKYLVLLSMGLLVVAVHCTGLFCGAWIAARDLEKQNS
jgi:hypothetical protein